MLGMPVRKRLGTPPRLLSGKGRLHVSRSHHDLVTERRDLRRQRLSYPSGPEHADSHLSSFQWFDKESH
jgi:hypothetical protein